MKKDYGEVRKAIESILDVEGYDDGSYGPLLVRLGRGRVSGQRRGQGLWGGLRRRLLQPPAGAPG